MRQLGYKTKLWASISFFSTLVTLVTFLLFGLVYYYLSNKTLRSSLISQTNELIRSHLIVDTDKLFFQKDKAGNSLAAYLRDEDLSAIIFDSNQKILATYGIFSDPSVPHRFESLNTFSTLVFSNRNFLTLASPIQKDNTTYGYLLLAKSSQLQSDFNRLALLILFPVLFITSIFGWFFSSKLTNFLLSPLDKIIKVLDSSNLHNLLPLDTHAKQTDHLSRLSFAYNDLIQRLNQGYENQKLFISRASHELKTPLANLLSTTELLELDLQSHQDPSLQKRFEKIKTIISSQSQQIDTLLQLSKLTYKTSDQQTLNLRTFFQSLLTQNQKQILDKNLTIELNLDPGKEIVFSKNHLNLIFQNLLANSIKYNKVGGIIYISSSQIDNILSVSISDTGHGIDEQDIQKIFDPFFRSSNASSLATGSGVGLNLVKQLCDFHKLSIEITSELGRHTTVKISGFQLL